MPDGHHRLKKLRWKSRRGMKELDVLLEAFFAEQADSLAAGEWPQLETLLECEDDQLYDWVCGRESPHDRDLKDLVDRIAHAR